MKNLIPGYSPIKRGYVPSAAPDNVRPPRGRSGAIIPKNEWRKLWNFPWWTCPNCKWVVCEPTETMRSENSKYECPRCGLVKGKDFISIDNKS